jgi:hypothetical protein
MAVVKLKYIRGREQIKAHLRYITHRRGKTQEKITRLLFGRDGLTDKLAIYQMIDNAKRGTTCSFSISPGNFIETKPQRIEKQGITFLNSPICPDLLRRYDYLF